VSLTRGAGAASAGSAWGWGPARNQEMLTNGRWPSRCPLSACIIGANNEPPDLC